MQQLLSELYKQTSIQSTLTWTTWGLLLFGLLYVGIYIQEHQFDEKNWKYLIFHIERKNIMLIKYTKEERIEFEDTKHSSIINIVASKTKFSK